MPRVPIPGDNQDQVLLLSRRRCCICFGLNGDLEEKQGQIAHLDRDNTNFDLNNLAFLCLFHHDKYDTKPSQSKRLRAGEVKHFRKELYDKIAAGLPAETTPKPSLSTEPADRANLHVVELTFEAPGIQKLESIAKLEPDTFILFQATIPRPTASIVVRNVGKYRVSDYVIRTAMILSDVLGPGQENELFERRPEWQIGGIIGTGNVWYPDEEKVVHTKWNQFFQPPDWPDLVAGKKVFYIVTKSGCRDQHGPLPETRSCRRASLGDGKLTIGLCWAHNT